MRILHARLSSWRSGLFVFRSLVLDSFPFLSSPLLYSLFLSFNNNLLRHDSPLSLYAWVLLKDEDERLGSSGVNEMGLSQSGLRERRVSAFRLSAHDDAFSPLTPEDYVGLRLDKVARYYEQRALSCARRSSFVNIAVYALGGLGSALALVDEIQIFVAVTTALSSALVTLMEKEKYQEKIFVYNRCLADLTSVLTWWRSLSAISKANPQKFGQLVLQVEQIKENEIRALFPAAFKGDKEGEGAAVFNSVLFRQDVVDNIDSRGRFMFKRTWVERHNQFFAEYHSWMQLQGMWEKIPSDQEVSQKPPVAELITEEFLESSVIDLTPIRRGYELLVKWVTFWNGGERNKEDWWNEGPKDPPYIGMVEAASEGEGEQDDEEEQ